MVDVLYRKEVLCPVCGSTFKTSKVRLSRSKVEKRDEDFCIYYKGENPIYYEVWVCPECGYAAMEAHFQDIDEWGRDKVRKNISVKWRKRSYGSQRGIDEAINCYKLALYCSRVIEAKASTTASLCLRLAWLYRMQQDPREKEFLKHALNFYMEAFSKERFPIGKMNEITMMYLIGELHRRLGNYEEAVKWFNRVVSHPSRHSNPAIEKMARDQWHLAAQQRKQSDEEIVEG
jgi:hypothetical protein